MDVFACFSNPLLGEFIRPGYWPLDTLLSLRLDYRRSHTEETIIHTSLLNHNLHYVFKVEFSMLLNGGDDRPLFALTM